MESPPRCAEAAPLACFLWISSSDYDDVGLMGNQRRSRPLTFRPRPFCQVAANLASLSAAPTTPIDEKVSFRACPPGSRT